jgi:phosphatidylglycerophosphate synthase
VRDTIPALSLLTPNLVTAVRALIVVMVAQLALRPLAASPVIVIALAAVALILDGVDGWLARRTNTATEFGARFDMEVDAALILVLALFVWQLEKAGPWILLSGLMRYLFVASGWIWPWMRRPVPSSFRGKFVCVVQTIGLMIALLPVVEPPVSTAIAAVSLAALCYSFFVDTLWLYRCGDST